MKLKEAEQLLDKFLNSILTVLYFKHVECLEYVCFVNEAVAQLSFPCRLSASGTGLFTIGIGLRYESLSQWLEDDPSEMRSTIGKPINLLRETTKFIEWEFSNVDDLEKQRDIIVDDIKSHVFPYIERYSRLADLRKALESKNKEDWISAGVNVDSRVTVLAAIQFIDGDKSGAIKTLNDGIKALEDTLAGRWHELRKRRFHMEYLHDRFLKVKKDTK